MQKTVEKTVQDNSAKILESRALTDGEEVTVLDVRVEEIFEVSAIHRVIDFEKNEDALELYLGHKRPDNTVYYLDDLRKVEKLHYSNVELSLNVQDDILEVHELILADKESIRVHDRPLPNEIRHKTKVFDSEGHINGKPSLLTGAKNYHVEVDVDTPLGEKTVTREFHRESLANRLRDKITGADTVELEISDSTGLNLRLEESVRPKSSDARNRIISLLIMGLLVPVLSVIFYTFGMIQVEFFQDAFFLSILLNTLPSLLGVACEVYSSSISSETRELAESVSEDSTVEAVDIERGELPQPQSHTVRLDIENDKTTFSVVNEPIRWTFGATDRYPSSDAVEFAEYIGIENIEDDEFAVVTVPNTQESDGKYVSDCGGWVVTSG